MERTQTRSIVARTLRSLYQSDMFERFENMKYLPRWMVFVLDVVLCVIAYLASYLIGHSLLSFEQTGGISSLGVQLVILAGTQTLVFWVFRTYSGILRYSTFVDVTKVLLSVLTAAAVLLAGNAVAEYYRHKVFDYNVLAIYMAIAFLMLFSLRLGVKTVYEAFVNNMSGKEKVLIYGTRRAGIAIAKMLKSSGDSRFRLVGFIEDANDTHLRELLGMKVVRLDGRLPEYMKRKRIRNVIISPLKMKELTPSRDLTMFLNNNIRIFTTPYFQEWERDNEQGGTIGSIEKIKVEDLLERPVIQIDTENVRATIRNKVVMVTGAAGSIGSELVRQVAGFGPKVIILFEQAESPLHDLTMDMQAQYPEMNFIGIIGDIRDRARVETIMADLRPDIVFHAAAYKHVPLMEGHPNEAIRTNVGGTKNVADMAVKYGVERFVMISTDKAVNPTNIMGASKRIAEMYVQSLFHKLHATNDNCTKFITTRFGNVLGSNGSVIPHFKKQIAAGGPVTVTHPDIIRYFMTIPEACCLVMEACTLGAGGEIFIFDMGHPVKILDLARNMIRLAGYRPYEDIAIEFTGLRPGEKLYEELLNQKETTLPTKNRKIMIARVREYDFDMVEKEINELMRLAQENTPFLTVAQMKRLVPEFVSRNSVYESLDINNIMGGVRPPI